MDTDLPRNANCIITLSKTAHLSFSFLPSDIDTDWSCPFIALWISMIQIGISSTYADIRSIEAWGISDYYKILLFARNVLLSALWYGDINGSVIRDGRLNKEKNKFQENVIFILPWRDISVEGMME